MGRNLPAEREAIAKLKARWSQYLRSHGLNTTEQREAIVDVFLHSREHVSIEEVLGRVRKEYPRLGFATVYRTMRLLVESGLAYARRFGEGHTRYEVAGDHHDHLICVECGLILEFESEEIERIQEEIARRLGGFRVLRHKHELYCLCPKAQGIVGGQCPRETLAGDVLGVDRLQHQRHRQGRDGNRNRSR
ncbi:MAG: transcriptional repressor [Pseudomonadota bacterium]